MNIVFISADDMSYFSTGLAGCQFPSITPTLDELGKQGVFFTNAHTTVGLCQPSIQSLKNHTPKMYKKL